MLVKLDDEYYSVDFTWSRREKPVHPPHAYLFNEYDDVTIELDNISYEIELLKNNSGKKHNYYRKNNC